jgi:hypothetical protein
VLLSVLGSLVLEVAVAAFVRSWFSDQHLVIKFTVSFATPPGGSDPVVQVTVPTPPGVEWCTTRRRLAW